MILPNWYVFPLEDDALTVIGPERFQCVLFLLNIKFSLSNDDLTSFKEILVDFFIRWGW